MRIRRLSSQSTAEMAHVEIDQPFSQSYEEQFQYKSAKFETKAMKEFILECEQLEGPDQWVRTSLTGLNFFIDESGNGRPLSIMPPTEIDPTYKISFEAIRKKTPDVKTAASFVNEILNSRLTVKD